MHGSDKPQAGNPLTNFDSGGAGGGFDSTGKQAKAGQKSKFTAKAPEKNQSSVKSNTSAVSASILNNSPTSVQIYI